MTDQPTAGEPAPADAAQVATEDLAAIMRLAPDSPYADLIAHESSRRRALFELLASSDDPLWKEIGTQLRDGQLQPRDVFGVEAYGSHLTDAIDKHGSDVPAMLANTREHLEAEAEAEAKAEAEAD